MAGIWQHGWNQKGQSSFQDGGDHEETQGSQAASTKGQEWAG
jgi:hypothetical protein